MAEEGEENGGANGTRFGKHLRRQPIRSTVEIVLSFGGFTLDPLRFRLCRSGAPVHLEPQVFDVLRYLVEHRDRVVPKEELLDEVWGSRFVSESTLTTRIKTARRALGDDGDSQTWIRTIRRRGYQFIGDVLDVDESPGASHGSAVPESIGFARGADGVRIAYASSGSGPPLVKAANWMTHLGHDRSSPVWGHWLDVLAGENQLVRYDERGCGLSEWEVPSLSFEDWVRDLEVVVDSAGLDRFALLGISQGAAVAVAYAVRHPERVERLVLVGGYAAGRAVRATNAADSAAAALDIELAQVGWGRTDAAFRRVFAMQFYPQGPAAMWEAFDALQCRTTSAANAVRFLETFSRIDVRACAPDVRAPALILHSRDDHRVPFANAELLHQLIPRSRLVSLPSANHLLTADEPAWSIVVDEVRSWLSG